MAVARAIAIMMQREELEYKNRRKDVISQKMRTAPKQKTKKNLLTMSSNGTSEWLKFFVVLLVI
jgi:hypothetical protein